MAQSPIIEPRAEESKPINGPSELSQAMKILALVEECRELDEGFEVEDNRIDEKYFSYSINEADEYTVEEAVSIKESGVFEDVEVVVATIGPARSVQTLRKALAMGADRAIRIWDDELDREILRDRHIKADILGSLIEDEGPGLVFAGVQSDDESFGGTGVMVANTVDYEWAAAVVDVDLDDPDCIRVERELEGGALEVVEVTPPAVFTVQAGINEPRYTSARSIYKVGSQKEVAEVDLSQLGVDAASGRDFSIEEVRQPEATTTYFEGETDEIANQISTLLEDKGVIR